VDGTQADDTGSLKSAILGYLNIDKSLPLNPPIHPGEPKKALCGWNHPVTAALLMPMEWDANNMCTASISSFASLT